MNTPPWIFYRSKSCSQILKTTEYQLTEYQLNNDVTITSFCFVNKSEAEEHPGTEVRRTEVSEVKVVLQTVNYSRNSAWKFGWKFRTTGTIMHFAHWGLLFCHTLYSHRRVAESAGICSHKIWVVVIFGQAWAIITFGSKQYLHVNQCIYSVMLWSICGSVCPKIILWP